MKKHFLLTILTLTFGLLKGQSLSKLENEFMQNFYKNHFPMNQPSFYRTGISPYQLSAFKTSLQIKDSLQSWKRMDDNHNILDSLVLSRQEREFIISNLEKQADSLYWTGPSVPNASEISADTLNEIFSDAKKGWNYFHSKYGGRLNSFTIPVFFRENQLCAFYYDKTCGRLCGEGVFAIYKKKKERWIIWFVIYEWVS